MMKVVFVVALLVALASAADVNDLKKKVMFHNSSRDLAVANCAVQNMNSCALAYIFQSQEECVWRDSEVTFNYGSPVDIDGEKIQQVISCGGVRLALGSVAEQVVTCPWSNTADTTDNGCYASDELSANCCYASK